MVVDRMDPDQIILFGSGARAELREASDLDLLVVSRSGNRRRYPARQRWSCERTGDELDVVVTSRQTAERRRRSAAYIHGRALEANYDPERTWTTLRKAGGDLIAHAEELVPVLVKQTRDRLDGQRTPEPVPPPSPGAHRR